MGLSTLRAAIRKFAFRKQSAWMAALDAGLEKISAEQRAKGKLHTVATAEAFSACATMQLADVGSEVAAHIIEFIEAAGPGVLSNRDVLGEYTATMKFGRDRLASKVLTSIRNLGLPNPRDGTDGVDRMNRLCTYDPGESRLANFFEMRPDAPNSASKSAPKSAWQKAGADGYHATAPKRVWRIVLLILFAAAAGALWLFLEMR